MSRLADLLLRGMIASGLILLGTFVAYGVASGYFWWILPRALGLVGGILRVVLALVLEVFVVGVALRVARRGIGRGARRGEDNA